MAKQWKFFIAFFLTFNAMVYGSAEESCYIVNAELLYFKPTIDQSSYVISSSDNHVGDEYFPNGQRHLNRSTYKPGVRLEGIYELCQDMAFDARGAYFNASQETQVTGDFLYDTIGSPGDGAQAPEDRSYTGFANIRDHYRYGAIDATFNRVTLDSCIDNLSLLFGLHYANIRHTTDFTSSGTFVNDGANRPISNNLQSNSRFWGIGPQLGLDYRYRFVSCGCGTFSIGGNTRASLLCSNTKANYHFNSSRTTSTAGTNMNNDDLWRVTPALDARIEGCYQFSCHCWDVTVALGYEWIWYADSVDSIRGIDVAFAGDSIDVFSNFSLQGPYLKIGIAF